MNQKSDNCLKQVPLMFMVMSGMCKKDYRKAFEAVRNLLPNIAVHTVTLSEVIQFMQNLGTNKCFNVM